MKSTPPNNGGWNCPKSWKNSPDKTPCFKTGHSKFSLTAAADKNPCFLSAAFAILELDR